MCLARLTFVVKVLGSFPPITDYLHISLQSYLGYGCHKWKSKCAGERGNHSKMSSHLWCAECVPRQKNITTSTKPHTCMSAVLSQLLDCLNMCPYNKQTCSSFSSHVLIFYPSSSHLLKVDFAHEKKSLRLFRVFFVVGI